VCTLAGSEVEASQNKTLNILSTLKPSFMNPGYPEKLELFLEQEIASSDELAQSYPGVNGGIYSEQ